MCAWLWARRGAACQSPRLLKGTAASASAPLPRPGHARWAARSSRPCGHLRGGSGGEAGPQDDIVDACAGTSEMSTSRRSMQAGDKLRLSSVAVRHATLAPTASRSLRGFSWLLLPASAAG